MESRTVSEDSVADTGAKTTDEESEIEEQVARNPDTLDLSTLSHIGPYFKCDLCGQICYGENLKRLNSIKL